MDENHAKDLKWLREVYQGDHARQLTLRAVMTGGLLGMVLSISNLYTTLKLGWAFGVAITACVLSHVLWNGIRALSGGKMSRMTMLENNCMQSTASAAGYSTGGTVGSAFAALYLFEGVHQPWWVVAGMVLLTAALGVFLAIPMKRRMIQHEELPFPSGIAAAETLRGLYSEGREAIRKARALVLGIAVGGLFGVLKNLPALAETYAGLWLGRLAGWWYGWMPVPELLKFRWDVLPNGIRISGVGFEPGVLMLGAGMIMGLRMALSMLLGSALLCFVIAPYLVAQDIAMAGNPAVPHSIWQVGMDEVMPRRWGVWGGTALMVFASLTSFSMHWRKVLRALRFGLGGNVSPIAHLEVPIRWMWIGLVPISIGLVALLHVAFGLGVFAGLLAVAMSFVLALVACRATGEADTTPIGAMGKVTQLLYAVLVRNNPAVNLMAAGVTASAAGSAADLLTDLKSGHLLGTNPRRQFLAQFYGIFFGTLAIVPAWYALAPSVQGLTDRFPMPAANAWKAMADLLANGLGQLPQSAAWAVMIGGVLGVALPLIEVKWSQLQKFIPSAMGMGLGMIVDFSNSLGFAIGALIAWAWQHRSASSAADYKVPFASGLVAGESLFAAIIAILCAAAGMVG